MIYDRPDLLAICWLIYYAFREIGNDLSTETTSNMFYDNIKHTVHNLHYVYLIGFNGYRKYINIDVLKLLFHIIIFNHRQSAQIQNILCYYAGPSAEIISRHGGKIGADSTLGDGSAF